jgi:putative ABC transport system ATP-binding protein
MAILHRLNKEENVAVLMVTHEADLAKTADRLVRMKDGEILQ